MMNKKSLPATAALSCLLVFSAAGARAGAGFDAGQSLDAKAFLAEVGAPVDGPRSCPAVSPVTWAIIEGGTFMLGADDDREGREVTVKTFALAKTLVTVSEYARCVAQGACTMPGTSPYCNWSRPERGDHPITCVTWEQANQYAQFAGARLPTESEWEFAATGRGAGWKYPWGNSDPRCDDGSRYGRRGDGCGGDSVPVCSKPRLNTKEGVCEMSGNVSQWLQDVYFYDSPRVDGSPRPDKFRAIRGGALSGARFHPSFMRSTVRDGYIYNISLVHLGFRLARTIP